MAAARVMDEATSSKCAVLANGKEIDLMALYNLHETIMGALDHSTALRQTVIEKLNQLRALELCGIDFARPLYQGKYLYRHVPAEGKEKKRRRLYVGAGADKTGPALAAMHRGMSYNCQAIKLRALINSVDSVHRLARQLVKHLEAVRTG
jgi:hypothetical protein